MTETRELQVDELTIGVGFFHTEEPISRKFGCLTTRFPNGMVRRTFLDREGRSYMTGWFYPGAF